jgi:transposase
MRTIGNAQQRTTRRQKAFDLLKQGRSTAVVASSVGVSQRSVQRWQHQATTLSRKPRAQVMGRPPRLTTKQVGRLETALARGAYAHGYAEDYWTLDRVAQLIWRVFAVRYHPSAVWHLLRRMGWSCQKPQRVSMDRDDREVAHWLRHRWWRIKKVARPVRDAHLS